MTLMEILSVLTFIETKKFKNFVKKIERRFQKRGVSPD